MTNKCIDEKEEGSCYSGVSKKKRNDIVVSIISHSSGLGGGEQAVLELIDILQKNHISVFVVLPGDGPLEEALKERGVDYKKIALQWWANVNDDVGEVWDKIYLDASRLANVICDAGSNIIYTTSTVIPEGAIAARLLGVSHVWNISEFGREEHGISYMVGEIERKEFICKYSQKIFFVSHALREFYEKDCNVGSKSKVFYPLTTKRFGLSVSAKKSYFSSDKYGISVIGGIAPGKGQKDVILAMREIVLQGDQDIEVLIAGDICHVEYDKELHKIIEDNNLQKKIKFIGFVENVEELINQSNLIINPSVYEGFGRVTAEAMMRERPVIAARSGATIELIEDNKSGLLYEAGDYKELAEKIVFAKSNNDIVEGYVRNAKEFSAETFDFNTYEKRIVGEIVSSCDTGETDGFFDDELIRKVVRCLTRKGLDIDSVIEENRELKKELDYIKNSKFWKIRCFYMNMKRRVKK